MQRIKQLLRLQLARLVLLQDSRRLLPVFLSAFLCSVVGLTTLNVQAQDSDVIAPTIELEEIDKGIAGETQVFTAEVSDDRNLVSVILFHRLAGDELYLSTEMEAVAGTNVYSASVDHSTDDPRSIEYYLQAEDAGGNKALKGFAFDPFVRVMSPDIVAIAATTPTPATQVSRNRKILWGVLGLVAVAVLASQSGGSSSSNGGTQTNIPVDIVVNPVPDGFTLSF